MANRRDFGLPCALRFIDHLRQMIGQHKASIARGRVTATHLCLITKSKQICRLAAEISHLPVDHAKLKLPRRAPAIQIIGFHIRNLRLHLLQQLLRRQRVLLAQMLENLLHLRARLANLRIS